MSDSRKLRQQAKHDLSKDKKRVHYKCRVCKRYCRSKLCLKIHMKCHAKIKTNLYRCSVCHFSFTKKHVLDTHFHQVHFKSGLKTLNENDANLPQCKCCQQRFSSLLYLKKHVKPTLSQFSCLWKWINSFNISSFFPIPPKNPTVYTNGTRMLTRNNGTIPKKIDISHEKGKNRQTHVPSFIPVPISFGQGQGIKNIHLIDQRRQPVILLGDRTTTLIPQNQDRPKQMFRNKSKKKHAFQGKRDAIYVVKKPIYQSVGRQDVDSDSSCDLSDSEFISLLQTAFEGDTSENSSKPKQTEVVMIKNDHRYSQGQSDRINVLCERQEEDDSSTDDQKEPVNSKKVTPCVNGEKMQQLLHTHCSVDAHSSVYKCLSCQCVFSLEVKLLDHFQSHICFVCGNIFDQVGGLIQHKSNHQLEEMNNMKFNPTFVQDMFEKQTYVSEYGEMYTCNICHKQFFQRSHLFIHMYVHAEDPPGHSSQLGSNDPFTDTGSSHSRGRARTFSCTECNRSFYSRKNLNGHMETHVEMHQYFCPECGKGFRRRRGMLKHFNTHSKRAERKERTEIAVTSGSKQRAIINEKATASERIIYQQHLQSISGDFVVAACFTPDKQSPDHKSLRETKERIFSCPMCNKRFFSKQILVGHMEVHNPDKKFYCTLCNRGFRRKTTLARHIETHEKKKKKKDGYS